MVFRSLNLSRDIEETDVIIFSKILCLGLKFLLVSLRLDFTPQALLLAMSGILSQLLSDSVIPYYVFVILLPQQRSYE